MSEQKLSTQPYKGTRDFYPEDMRVRNFIFNKIRNLLTKFGYQEYDGPMLEPFELYASKTSDEIVNEQLYSLIDRGDRKLAVRPEMTPTLARMVAARRNELPKPIRWFSFPNLWRYERPQRGRLREHWQLNVDVFGGSALWEDLEVCQIIVAIMQSFGANEKQFEVKLNHREVTNALFKEIIKLNDAQIGPVGRLLDAALKMKPEAFEAGLRENGLNSEQIDIMKNLLTPNGKELIFQKLQNNPALKHIQSVLKNLEELNLFQYFKFDPSVMRGFMYYTGLVLEVYDLHPENNRAMFGGGRYDNLVGMFGREPLSGIGFGMGDVTFRNFLETHKLLPDLNQRNGVYIAPLDEQYFLEAQKCAEFLRSQNITCFQSLENAKLKKHIQNADRLNAFAILMIGEEESKSKNYTFKNLNSGEQIQLKLTDFPAKHHEWSSK